MGYISGNIVPEPRAGSNSKARVHPNLKNPRLRPLQVVFTSKSVNLFQNRFQTTKSSTIFLPSPSANCVTCEKWFYGKFLPWPSKWMGEEWQFNKSKSRGHGRYQSITRQSATIWLHFRARRAGPSFCWKLTLFKNVFQVQTLWWCWWLVHSVEIMEIYFNDFLKKISWKQHSYCR